MITVGSAAAQSPVGAPSGETERLSVSAEALVWWFKSASTPPLVSTGGLDRPGTTVLLGDEDIDTGANPGFRLSAGFALTERWGLDSSFFYVPTRSTSHSVSSSGQPGSTGLFIPFYDVTIPGENATRLSSPGFFAGSAREEFSTSLLGAELNGTMKLTSLAADVTKGPAAWREGSWIAVATTSFSPFETEFVQLEGAPRPDGAGGSQVTLAGSTKLKFYHYGGEDPGPPAKDSFRADKSKNYGVDERAEVGLITRSIKLTAEISAAAPFAGGEIKILKNFAEVVIQGVELEKFGKAQLGSYPIHVHQVGPVTQPLVIKANSVHHSFNKCVTIHSSSNITIADNVCARIVGHIFYQEIGDESNIRFERNLGLGAMSHSFDVHGAQNPAPPERLTRAQLIDAYWWPGDYLARSPNFGYDGLNVPNRDDQRNPTHRSCTTVNGDGQLQGYDPPPCVDKLYIEPASGFWIINPATALVGNSIAGCQGIGVGYWYVAPADASPTALKFRPLGEFSNNRVHGCYSGVYNEALSSLTTTGQFHPHADGTQTGKPVIAFLDGITATRNRSRGIWLRPTWIVVEHARLATNRENVTLVSSGGADGNAPGVWQMLRDSVVVGLSENNVDRFGPCFSQVGDRIGNPSSGMFGCIDATANPTLQQGGDEVGRGYPDPNRNSFGYMLYDGPVLVFDTRFVNWHVDITPHLTTKDRNTLADFARGRTIISQPPSQNAFVYEGDAALGWFQANQSAYPTATASSGLIFENTDLRHQIYTQDVNIDKFQDGDKNTAIIDLDGTLTGLVVVDKDQQPVPGAFPVSLNNLPFHHYGGSSGGSVDECFASGGQNRPYEGRATSLISPGSIGTLEFGALWPELAPLDRVQKFSHWQQVTFTRDSVEFPGTASEQRPSLALSSRNGLGIWEPKVTSGYGYTVTASVLPNIPPPYCLCGSGPPCPDIPGNPLPPAPLACRVDPAGAGIPSVIDVGVADVVKANIEAEPFHVRLGICYTGKGDTHPKFAAVDAKEPRKLFTITRGYKSYGNLDGNVKDEELRGYWNKLEGRYKGQTCNNLDDQNRTSDTAPSNNLKPGTGCPANGITALPDPSKADGGCRPPSKKETWTDPDDAKSPVSGCVFPTAELEYVDDIAKLTKSDGTPDFDKYFYDEARGLLYLHVAQTEANAFGPSPLGSCRWTSDDDPSCPNRARDESYYSCPAQGCTVYIVRLNDPTYEPAASKCEPYPVYHQDPPEQKHFLADRNHQLVAREFNAGVNDKFPHYRLKNTTEGELCK